MSQGSAGLAIARNEPRMVIDGKPWMIGISGHDGRFSCRQGTFLLSAMIDARHAQIKVGCRNGGCGICRVKVIEGDYSKQKMSRSRISENDEAEGIVLACRISPQSDMVVEPMPLRPTGKARCDG